MAQRPSPELVTLLTRGIMSASVLVMAEALANNLGGRFYDVNLDHEFEIQFLTEKMRFEALAKALRGKTMSASEVDFQTALREAALYRCFDTSAGRALIQKLSGTGYKNDAAMVVALDTFAHKDDTGMVVAWEVSTNKDHA